MTALDYSPLVAVAEEMVADFGRDVKLRRKDATSVSGKPWRGDPAAPADTTVKALFVGPRKVVNEDFLQGLDDVAIVAGNIDLLPYHEIVDGTTVWRITKRNVIKPGDTIILTYLGVNR